MQSEQYSRTLVLQRNLDTCNHRRANHSNHQPTSHCQVNSAPNKCTRLNESGGIYLIKMSHESVKQKHTQTHTQMIASRSSIQSVVLLVFYLMSYILYFTHSSYSPIQICNVSISFVINMYSHTRFGNHQVFQDDKFTPRL